MHKVLSAEKQNNISRIVCGSESVPRQTHNEWMASMRAGTFIASSYNLLNKTVLITFHLIVKVILRRGCGNDAVRARC